MVATGSELHGLLYLHIFIYKYIHTYIQIIEGVFCVLETNYSIVVIIQLRYEDILTSCSDPYVLLSSWKQLREHLRLASDGIGKVLVLLSQSTLRSLSLSKPLALASLMAVMLHVCSFS